MRIVFSFFFIILFVQLCFSQTAKVVDKENLKPISNAEVSSEDVSYTTDASGIVDLKLFKGELIKVSATGYQTMFFTLNEIKSENYVISLTSKSYTTDEIVISADRYNELYKDVPRQIDIINEKEIKNLNATNTAQLLEKSGNVFVQTSQLGGGSPIIRGFEASRVLIVVDGIRLNNAIFRSGHLQNVLRVDQNILDKAEILYGPGSLMYGSDALGGVMAFYTRNPKFSLTDKILVNGDAFARYSTANNEKTGHLNISLGAKKFSFLGSFTFSDFGDLRMGGNYEPTFNENWKRKFYVERIGNTDVMTMNDNVNILKGSGYQQYDALGKLLIKTGENALHTFQFQYSNTNDVPRYDRLNRYSGSNLQFAEWYYGPEQRMLGAYKLELKSKSFFDNAQIIAGYQNIKESRINRRFNNVNRFSQNEKVDVLSLNADFNKKVKEHEIRYGLEGTYNIVKSTATKLNILSGVETPDQTRYPDGDNNMMSLAAYLSHSWEINPKFTLSEGVRFNYVTLKSTFIDTAMLHLPYTEAEQNNAAINGSLGLVYMPDASWKIYLNGSTGFRAPNFDDLSKVFETNTGAVIVPNSDLKPEYTYTGELGISKIFDNRIKIEGVAYGTYFTNAIITDRYTFNGQDSILYQGVYAPIYANQNAENGAYILGYSLNFAADFTNYLSMTSSVNFTYGRIKTDSIDAPLDHIPPVMGKTSMILKLNRFTGDLTVMYNGWKRTWDYNFTGEDNFGDATPNGMPSWYTLNAGASYQITSNLQIQARLNNILDKNYRTFASGINAPGRNFILSLRASL